MPRLNSDMRANQWRKKRGSYELDEVVDKSKTKRQKITSSSNEKVSVPSNPAETSLRAAAIKIRYADTIVKAKSGQLRGKSSNKGDVIKKLQEKKEGLERRKLEEKSRIEAELEARRLKVRRDSLLAVKKVKEEATSSILDDQRRKKRDSYELDEVVDQSKTKKQKITSSSNEKVSVPVETFVEAPERALRAAAIMIRFAGTIAKAKYGKLLDQSSNKSDVMKKIQEEKESLEKRQLEEKARIEAVLEAPRLKVRHDTLLAVKKIEEEATSILEDNIYAEMDFVKLFGGPPYASMEFRFGLVLRRDEEFEEEACGDLEEGEIF